MESLDLVAIVVGGLAGLLGGAAVPRLVAWCPDPAPDPDENPEDFPDHVPFAELAARRGLGLRCSVAGALSGGVLGLAVGWGWGLTWLLYLVPVGIALALIDYVTWYLPSRLILPSYGVVAVLEVVAALALGEPGVLLLAAVGGVGLGLYYGLLWLVSPRMMAFGDVRLGALLGLALGPFGLITVVVSVAAAAVLAVLGLVPLRRGGNMIKRKVPFGPFLLGGALLAVALSPLLAG